MGVIAYVGEQLARNAPAMHRRADHHPIDVDVVVVLVPADGAQQVDAFPGGAPLNPRRGQCLVILLEWRQPVVADQLRLERIRLVLQGQQLGREMRIEGRVGAGEDHARRLCASSKAASTKPDTVAGS